MGKKYITVMAKETRISMSQTLISIFMWILVIFIFFLLSKKEKAESMKLITKHNPRNVLLNEIEKSKFILVYDIPT